MNNMRWILLAFTFLLLALHASAVEYDRASPINLSVRTSAKTLPLGGIVHILIQASDQDIMVNGARINDPITVTWQANGGSISKFSQEGIQPIDLLWTVPNQPGFYSVIITATDSGRFAVDPPVRRVAEVAVQQAGTTTIPTVRVAATPQTIRVNRQSATSTISADLLGKDNANKDVRFFSTAGTLSTAQAKTNASGVASVVLTVTPQDDGTATVGAFYGNTSSTTTVQIVANQRDQHQYTRPLPPFPPYSPAFLISVEPPVLPADGRSTANVTVRITDIRGLGIRNQNVDFTVSYGLIQRRMLTNLQGYATVILTAPPTPGDAIIYATSGAQQSYTRVSYLDPASLQQPAGPPRLYLTVAPNSAPADGTTTVAVTVLALDSNGRALADAPISFSSSLGTVQTPEIRTNDNGQAGTYIVAPTIPGMAVVAAQLDDITAASQISFQTSTTNGPSLNISSYSEQQTSFAAEKWIFRRILVNNGTAIPSLQILDLNGVVARQIDLNSTARLIRDQYGAARGYGIENAGKVTLNLLQADGTPQKAFSMILPADNHLVDIQYANPQGNFLVLTARNDDSNPQVTYLSAEGKELFSLKDGLEKMPAVNMGSDGYLALALYTGVLRIYSPQGNMLAEIKRTDGLPSTQVVIGPGGDWIAAAGSLSGQTEITPKVVVYSRQNALRASLDIDAVRLAAAGKDGLLIASSTLTSYLNLATKTIVWTLTGVFDRMLEYQGIGVIAQLDNPQATDLPSRIMVIRLNDGAALGSQNFPDLRGITAILPPDANGQVCVVTTNSTFRFSLPKGN